MNVLRCKMSKSLKGVMIIQDVRFLRKCYLTHFKRKASNIKSSNWQSVVGLEVHAQISSYSKLFSGSSNNFASPVNNSVSLFDSSIPGTLPVLNKQCVEAGVVTALALNCNVNPVSTFDRKHYFYADLPVGYQITQQRAPLANGGYLQFEVYAPGIHKKPYTVRSRIKQLQLEQDSGKSLHERDRSLVDLNRAGNPLMELVFEPDLKDGEEAASLVKELAIILQRLGTCSCKMEEGALRVDANVSVHRTNDPLGTRTEVKNIGSIRGVAGAIKYEIERQIAILEAGGSVINETRAWDAASKTTSPMRDKEQQQDYRYMPEPNLPPLHVAIGPIEHGAINVSALQKIIPELPEQTRTRLKEELGLTPEQAIILVNDNPLLSLFEKIILQRVIESKLVANILINDFLALINREKLNLNEITINVNHFGEIVELFQNGIINKTTTQALLEKLIQGNVDAPSKIVMEADLAQMSKEDDIKLVCEIIIQENPKIVKQYKDGKTKVFKALLGLVATKTNHRANMSLTPRILKKLLDGLDK